MIDRVDVLRAMIKNLKIAHFMKTPKGIRHVGGVEFKLRVGLFLGHPTKAIIAEGLFVKMAAALEFPASGFALDLLDPTNPKTCLYGKYGKARRFRPLPRYRYQHIAWGAGYSIMKPSSSVFLNINTP